MPLFKFTGLLIRTLSKPVANAIKRRAVERPTFRARCAAFAQSQSHPVAALTKPLTRTRASLKERQMFFQYTVPVCGPATLTVPIRFNFAPTPPQDARHISDDTPYYFCPYILMPPSFIPSFPLSRPFSLIPPCLIPPFSLSLLACGQILSSRRSHADHASDGPRGQVNQASHRGTGCGCWSRHLGRGHRLQLRSSRLALRKPPVD